MTRHDLKCIDICFATTHCAHSVGGESVRSGPRALTTRGTSSLEALPHIVAYGAVPGRDPACDASSGFEGVRPVSISCSLPSACISKVMARIIAMVTLPPVTRCSSSHLSMSSSSSGLSMDARMSCGR